MRNLYKAGLVSAVALMTVSLVVGQQPGGKGGKGGGGFGGGGFGGFGGGKSTDPVSLLNNKSVQKELKVTEEQLEQLPEAVMKALKGVLDDKQYQRLTQIQLQQKGINAFKDSAIQSKLGFTKAQKEDISALFSDNDKEMAKLREGGKGGKGGFNKEAFQKMGELRKELDERVKSVLNDSQKATWREMIGEEFKLAPAFGGFGGGGKKPPKKDDA